MECSLAGAILLLIANMLCIIYWWAPARFVPFLYEPKGQQQETAAVMLLPAGCAGHMAQCHIGPGACLSLLIGQCCSAYRLSQHITPYMAACRGLTEDGTAPMQCGRRSAPVRTSGCVCHAMWRPPLINPCICMLLPGCSCPLSSLGIAKK